MSTTTGSECFITGGKVECPANSDFTFGAAKKTLDADITCPLNSVDQTQFRDMSQKGLCTCDAKLIDTNPDPNDPDPPEPLDCTCYVCPDGTKLGFGYKCTEPIFNDCFSFNCNFECNGDDENTQIAPDSGDEPTSAPMEESAAFNLHQTPLSLSVWLLVWMVFHMRR
jgi:hypothetical protein